MFMPKYPCFNKSLILFEIDCQIYPNLNFEGTSLQFSRVRYTKTYFSKTIYQRFGAPKPIMWYLNSSSVDLTIRFKRAMLSGCK